MSRLYLKNSDQLAAISAGSVDAIYGGSFFLPLRDSGVIKLFYKTSEQGVKATGFGAFVGAEEFLQKYPDASARVVRGLIRARTGCLRRKTVRRHMAFGRGRA